ncbi:MAG: cytochrome ubiquinol oxidase subunit I [Bacteroidales bacterium]|jgi:cytochrome d ubiquinol oxidase subunit I|nr:cytochrome ubiquinol oxidase subunit I [Bacteroidales bacterium]
MELLDTSLVDWSRAQFALTAMYHWLFVPLTLGLGVIMAVMETFYVRTGKEEWKRAAKFWMTIFGINFAIGVATGIILEFEFGTNWSNYSWFVGDIFGAPLAIEGVLAFFMEATFISVMFFGWKRVGKKFHLTATWLTTLGATISSLWILVANAWMQYPVGTEFNPATVRNEMNDFWSVLFSPVAINKFFHTVISAWVLGSVFVIGVSSWFLLKKRQVDFALKGVRIGAVFGVLSSILLLTTGHGSAYHVAHRQPMKLAVMEGLYRGENGADLLAFGILNPAKNCNDAADPFLLKIPVPVPGFLSWLGYGDCNAFVPGVNDIIEGGYTLEDGTIALSFAEKQQRGKQAIQSLADYRTAAEAGDGAALTEAEARLKKDYAFFGYGYIDKAEDLIPNVPLVFYSFHVMVALGMYFIVFFIAVGILAYRRRFENIRWMQKTALWSIPLAYIAGQAGWIVAEVGRQPWAIQDVLPVNAAISNISASSVQITFFVFLTLFSLLLAAEVGIMTKQIRKGPEAEKMD